MLPVNITFFYIIIILCVERLTVCPEEKSILMTSFVDSLSHLQDKEGKFKLNAKQHLQCMFVILY